MRISLLRRRLVLHRHKVAAPRIAEAAIQMECKLDHIHEIRNGDGKVTASLCIVKVVLFHINQACYDEERGVAIESAVRPIGRLGGDTYSQTRETFDLPRPLKDGTPGNTRPTMMN